MQALEVLLLVVNDKASAFAEAKPLNIDCLFLFFSEERAQACVGA